MTMNIREFDDSVNPIMRHPFTFAFLMNSYLFIVCTWRNVFTPHVVFISFLTSLKGIILNFKKGI
jgi:hypothetical protein